jgi:internalin A
VGIQQQDDRAIVAQLEQVIGQELGESVKYDEQGRVSEVNLSSLELTSVPLEVTQLMNLLQLDLSNNQLSQVPVELGQLSNLQTLDLDNNQLSQVPVELGQLSNLQTLRLNNNQLSQVPIELGQLSNLQTLFLDNNQLSQVPIELGQLTLLTRFDLDNNQLSQVPSELGQLSNLQELWLSHNQLSQIPIELGQLSNLETLDLENNQLSQVPIELGQLSNLQELWLNNNQLSRVPSELGQLSNLQELDLDNNQLSRVTSELGQLSNLQELWLNNNQLSRVPSELGQLSNLQELDLDNNQLSRVPSELGQLSNLQALGLSDNQLKEVPIKLGQLSKLQQLKLNNNQLSQLPVELGQLSNLQTLFLRTNQLSKVPTELGKLSNLQQLWLNNNQLSQLPVELGKLSNLQKLWLHNNQLSTVPIELGQLSNLQEFRLENNPLLTPPPEIVSQGTTAILSFLRELEQKSTIRYETKLILVGEGGTGKSSLLQALHGYQFQETSDTTHGIEVDTLSLPHPTLASQPITFNTWDFGGQDIYRATHQFFLTKRSLYLVVWNARIEASQSNLDYWLKTIHILAPDAPIVLVATHIDQRAPDLDEQQYRKAYPQIANILHVSSKDRDGIDHLKTVIASHAAKLPTMGQPWPQSWIEVEQSLLTNPSHHIPAEAYMYLCENKDIHANLARGTLGTYLHDLGRILYFPDDPILKDIVILKPNWITKAISWVLEDEATRNANGILQHKDLPRIWAKDEDGVPYDARLYPLFLRLMERFDLSYQIEPVFPEDHATRSLIPQLLSHQAPTALPSWSPANAGQMRVEMTYRFDFTPAGIMSWMIVRTHRYTLGLHWRNGAILNYQGHTARIEIFPMLNTLTIEVWGVQPYTFFVILKETLDLILTRFEGLQIRREVPCNCHIQTRAAQSCPEAYRYEKDLIGRFTRNIQTILCPESYQEVSVLELLYGIHVSTTQQVLETLEAGQLEILQEMRQFKNRNELLILQMQQLYEWNVRNFTRLWNLEMHRLEAECPNTFVLVTNSKTSFHPKNWISESYTLLLMCQNPTTPHCIPNDKGYELRQSKEWWSALYPWIKNLVTLLKYGVPLAGAVGAIVDAVDFKNFDAQVQLLEKISEDLPDIVESDPLQPASRTFKEGRVDEAIGSALRVLYHFLNEVDPAHNWSGLTRIVTPDGNILWLCPYHAQTYQAKVLQLEKGTK